MLLLTRAIPRRVPVLVLSLRAGCWRQFHASPSSYKSLADVRLPPPEEWGAKWRFTQASSHRVSVSNPQTAAKIAEAFVPAGSKDKIVIEAYPGPGQLTRALLALPRSRIKKLIVLEEVGEYLPSLTALQEVDDRIVVVPHSGMYWSSYDLLEEDGHLKDVQVHPWETLHPQLQWISHIPSTSHGEQLVSQLLRFIPGRQWLFKHGRIPLNMVLSSFLMSRMNAPPVHKSTSTRCKLTLIREATTTIREPLPFDATQPFSDHFHPAPGTYRAKTLASFGTRKDNKLLGLPFQTMTLEPHANELIRPDLLDKWDYCLRRMFVLKAQSVSRGLSLLGANGESLGKKLHDPSLPPDEYIDPDTKLRELTVQDWALIVKAFDNWPFAPEEIGIADAIHGETKPRFR
ncbi:S-adenosyl-L-methionine-dependent methyltransferase [Hymenopellis radicata]|nr:S-adenosyl-L-methionine-dependent methyltransferase [Hymenopellis radicata]